MREGSRLVVGREKARLRLPRILFRNTQKSGFEREEPVRRTMGEIEPRNESAVGIHLKRVKNAVGVHRRMLEKNVAVRLKEKKGGEKARQRMQARVEKDRPAVQEADHEA